MLQYTLTKEQYSNLCNLAYFHADIHYLRERHPEEKGEIEKVHKTICFDFELLDALRVPFWVQNTVLAFSESWRRYKAEYLRDYLNTKGIICP